MRGRGSASPSFVAAGLLKFPESCAIPSHQVAFSCEGVFSMSRIAAGSAEGAEQGYHPYLQDALLMGLFMFLCTEYLYVDVLSRMVSGDRAVLAQNEALGVSAVGFLLYPLAERSCRERLRLVLLGLAGLLSVGCIPMVCGGTAYRVTFPVGLVSFLLFGLRGGAVFTAAVALMPTDRYLAWTVGTPMRWVSCCNLSATIWCVQSWRRVSFCRCACCCRWRC